jgi:hypothetical protein
MIEAQVFSSLARSKAGILRQPAQASFAAATALATSSLPASCTSPSEAPFAGLMTGSTRPDFASCQAPP